MNKDLVTNETLLNGEMKNFHLAVGCGALNVMYSYSPGEDHTKVKRCLAQMHRGIIQGVLRTLPSLRKHRHQLMQEKVQAANVVLRELVKNGAKRDHVLLNLASYCFREMGLPGKYWNQFNKLFDLFPGAWPAEDQEKMGGAILHQIEKEYKILVAQREIM